MEETPDFDVIVVGSGMSGGWVAKEMCERGLKVCILDRGTPTDPTTDYSDNLDPWDRQYFDRVRPDVLERDFGIQDGNYYAVRESNRHFWMTDTAQPYEQAEGTRFKWRRGATVGGRSLMWGRASWRLAPYDFEANAADGEGVDWPVRYDDIAPWYDHVEKFAGICGNRDGLDQVPDGEHLLPPFEHTAAELDFKSRMGDAFDNCHLIVGRYAHLTKPTEEHMALGRGKCQARTRCEHGCSFGAYFSAVSATLPAAERTGNLTLLTGKVASQVVHDPNTNRVTGVRVVDANTGAGETYTARTVFLNASTIGTALILLNSATEAQPTGLANRSDQVGRNLMDHFGGSLVAAAVPGIDDSTVFGRRPAHAYIPRYRNFPARDQKGYKRAWGYQVYSGRWGWSGDRPGVGADYKAANRTPGEWSIMLDAFGEVLPHADNRVTAHKTRTDKWGQPIAVINFEVRDNDRALMDAAHADAVELFRRAGYADIREYRKPEVELANGIGGRIHEMGTARMGRDPETSVLNGFNQAHDIPNLFITDGSFMGSSGVVNPSLTYMAFSARAANHAADLMEEGVI